MRPLLFLAAAIAAIGIVFFFLRRREPPPPELGVSRTLAEERTARVSALKYQVTFRVPHRRDQPVRGHISASFSLHDARRPLAFDFAQPADHLLSIVANNRRIEAVIHNGHVVIPSRALVPGANVIDLDFVAGDEPLHRNDEFMYTLFVPARASLAMPCFDQPDLKARWRLILEIPTGWTAVSNGAETGRTSAPERTRLTFDETEPLPTYLFAFAAGKFTVETAVRGVRTLRMFHRETDAAKVARNREAIFDLHAHALAWLQEYTGIPYPFGKFDFVLIPSFQFTGMEHPGAITYNSGSLLLDESATQNQLLNRANVIAHETAHMWFGNLVTMEWFNDVWMKEVFANFMAAKMVNPLFPGLNHDLRFLLQNYPAAYDVDRTEGANPIRQQLENLDEAGSLYGAIVYQKAPIVLRQLELLVGLDAFRDGLREYLKRHSFANATWKDLVDLLDARTPEDLVSWSHAWVDEPGRPTVRTLLEIEGGRIGRLAFRQEDPRGRGLVWPQRLLILVSSDGQVFSFPVTLGAGETPVADAAGLAAPDWVLPAGGGLGYGFFDLDARTLEYLTHSLGDIANPLARGSALVAFWESMLEGRVPPARLLDQLLAALPRETDELNVAQMLDTLRAAFWRFTAARDRPAVAPRLEAVLRDGLSRARSTSLKAAWFAALRSTATMPDTVAWLEQVWRRDVKIAALPLAETDEAELALDLAVRGVPDAANLLQTQLRRFENPDRRARFQFVTPAVSPDPAARDRFFESLQEVKNRRREAWVLDAVRHLHHPLRAAQSKRYVRPALELLYEIRQTGDIFFPKRWADATLGGYQTAEAAAEVRGFIDRLPADYPRRLRWVLLSSADPLLRAARLLGR
ncbi:MAG: ERAP1-like C-terminal domain-containing protein [Acidobacteria bacterium]|nr:ERAP1-like C-terminal domain-containing protein [Acidobacteriota bacterium]